MSKVNDKEKNNNNNINSKNKEENNNSNAILNTSNDIDNNNEEMNIKRTLISPDVSPEDIKLLENNKNIDDNSSNILASTEERNTNNFNAEPFISPTMKKRNYKTISKMDKIIIEYNMVKYNINKIFISYQNQNQNKTKKEKYIKKLSEYNLSLLKHLSELSTLLNKIVENQKIYTNKNILLSSTDAKPKPKIIFVNNSPTQGIENTEKMLNYYEKQYTRVSERLKTVKNAQYVNDLKSKINDINEEILVIEKENRDLHKNQIIQGNLLKSCESGKSPELMENILIKKKEIYDKINNEFIKIIKKTEKDKENIKSNEEKIDILNEKCSNLIKMAKDMYNIDHFETVEKIMKKSKEKKLKYERKKREYEVNIHSIKSSINKLRIMYEQNKKDLIYMENEKNALIEKYQTKMNDLDLCSKKLKDYQNINMNFKQEIIKKSENGKINKSKGKNSNDTKEYNNRKKKLNIKIDSSSSNENKQKIIANYKYMNNDKLYNDIYDNSINQRKKNSIPILLSSGPSLISLTKEKSNFGDINDIQLLNTSNNDKNNNDNNDIKSNSPKIETKKKENIFTINKEIDKMIGKTETETEKDKIPINNELQNNNIIKEQEANKEIKNKPKNNKYISPIKLNIEDKPEKTIDVLNRNGAKSLSKEMILRGLDEQEKENKTLIYSSRITNGRMNKGYFDRRNLLKLNFSFVSTKKDNKLNMSLNTLPNERKLLNDEIEEDIMTDNSADNINYKESKIKKENDNKNKKNNFNNNSISIDKDLIEKLKEKPNDNNNNDNNKENNIVEDIIENNNENENKSQLENGDKNKRENALNTILYNVNENNQETKNDKFSQNNKTNNNNDNNDKNENKEEEQVNKSFEEEHIFDKKNEKEDDDVNYDFDDGDNIIDIDYDKI